jgi:hypothetical protein
VPLSRAVADRAYVIDDGKTVYSGPVGVLAKDRELVEKLAGAKRKARRAWPLNGTPLTHRDNRDRAQVRFPSSLVSRGFRYRGPPSHELPGCKNFARGWLGQVGAEDRPGAAVNILRMENNKARCRGGA